MDTTARPRAAIVVTGSELLTGTIADRNGPWLARQLTDLGFQVGQLRVVGDRPADLAEALASVADCALVVTCGGLGPTADDLTVECVARFAGVPLELDPGMYAQVARIVAQWALDTPRDTPLDSALEAGIRKQAMLPVGALALPPVGTAPGLVLDRPGGPLIVVLPGPPPELQGMWPAVLAAAPVAELLAGVPAASSRSLRFFGLSEPRIAQTLRELGVPPGLEVTTCLRRSELEVDIRPAPGRASAAAARVLADAIVDRHPAELVSADGTSTDELLAGALLDRGWFVATAESCTGGLVAARLTDRPGSSAYVAGGTVAYSNVAKVSQLDVSAETLAAHGAVSPQVARELADGARRRFGAQLGVGVTGVAGPDGGTPTKPVGYVCFCVTSEAGAVLARDRVLPGARAEVRERATDLAFHLLLQVVRGV